MKIVSVMWDLVVTHKQMSWSERTLSEEKIVQEVQKRFKDDRKLDADGIRRFLEVLVDEKCGDVSSGNEGRKYSVGMSCCCYWSLMH